MNALAFWVNEVEFTEGDGDGAAEALLDVMTLVGVMVVVSKVVR